MRHCYISLLVGLLVVTWIQSGVMASHAKQPVECCFQFYKSKIPHQKIKSYERTRSECALAGVIFMTVKDLQICVKPYDKWVKKAIQQFDKRQLQAQLAK
ncbi:C-C motif chemokine 36.1 [Triplophysa rosa]|uniref:C-C motif chemokine n=1 Tax=Triplophysa rosa TaxID=992332 RepID=A0A9W7X6P7_TRIRA|nr:C-C motif chemokine 36.1 [Triplophysa rosa]KAI7814926.1 putative C-C motif chemokine 3-like [Triplophysa rosa]